MRQEYKQIVTAPPLHKIQTKRKKYKRKNKEVQ